jgi:hypothetical protein
VGRGLAGALSAVVVAAGVSLVVLPAEPAAAVTVNDEASFRAAFTNPNETQIDVTADITLSNCALPELTRVSNTALTVVGNGHTLSQTCPGRAVMIQNGNGALSFNGLTITGGNNTITQGGGIRTLGAVTLENSSVTGNTAVVTGAGFWALGAVTLNNSFVTGNTATGPGITGGGLVANGGLTLFASDVSGNQGGGINVGGGTASINNSTVNGNTGIAIASGGVVPVTLESSTVSQNGSGIQADGPVSVEDSTVSGNGVVGATGSRADILRSTVSGNGAGIVSLGDVSVVASTVSGNAAGFGVSGGPNVAVDRSTVSGNASGVSGFRVTVSNATVSGNGTSGGIFGEIIQVNLSTVVGNAGAVGANIRALQSIITFGTVVALASGGAPNCSTLQGGTSKQFSVVDDASCGGPAEPNPLLGPLADNGGPTFTHLPQQGSPAINVIPVPQCMFNVDQRGVSRPQGTACDVGSVEVAGAVGAPPPGPSPGPSPEAGGPAAVPGASAAAAAVPFSGTPRFTG